VTPLHTTAPWYFLWLQGMLKIGDKFLMGIIAPGILTGVLLLLPYYEVGPSRRYGDRRVGLTVGLIGVAAVAILSFMGTPFYAVTTSPDQEVVAELVPQTNPGPLREADWTQLTAGTYEAANWQAAPNPTLKDLLKLYDDGMALAENGASCRRFNNCLVNAHGYMIVQDWQVGLKRVTLRVIWNGGPPNGQVCQLGAPNESCLVTFYEQNANYWQKP
jgi:cytochrome b/b6/petD-like protein